MYMDWLRGVRSNCSRRRKRGWEGPSVLEARVLMSAVPVGPETRVNTYTTNMQVSESNACDAQGNYIIVWESMGQDGSDGGVYAQRYSFQGVPQGPEFRVNTTTTGRQGFPDVAMKANGEFVVTWIGARTGSVYYDIFAQRYDPSGNPVGVEFKVNSSTSSDPGVPKIAMDSAGNFAICWYDSDPNFPGAKEESLVARYFYANGTPKGGDFLVHTSDEFMSYQPDIAADSAGNLICAWTGSAEESSTTEIWARRIDSTGTPQGEVFRVNNNAFDVHIRPKIAIRGNGDFVILWDSGPSTGGLTEVHGRLFNANGTPKNDDFRVSTTPTTLQEIGGVGFDVEGNFVASWEFYNPTSHDRDVYARIFNDSAAPIGEEFLVNSSVFGNQSQPSVRVAPNGNFVIHWRAFDGSDVGIFSQRFQVSHSDNLGVWRASRFYLDSNRNSLWNGSGTDTLNTFGSATDKPLAGDWNGDGYTDIGVWRSGTFYLDTNGNGIWDGPAIDKTFKLGLNSDTPVVGDWNGDGIDDIGVWRSGKFYLDLDGNRIWNSAIDKAFTFGAATDRPIIGDWNADGKADLGIWRSGKFYLDLNANRIWNSGVDGIFSFGNSTDTPLIGDWNGDGTDDLGVWRSGKFYQDTNGNRAWNSATDTVTTYGASTDVPLIGYWPPKTVSGASAFGLSPSPVASSAGPGSPASAPFSPLVSAPDSPLASLIAPVRKKPLAV